MTCIRGIKEFSHYDCMVQLIIVLYCIELSHVSNLQRERLEYLAAIDTRKKKHFIAGKASRYSVHKTTPSLFIFIKDFFLWV